MITAWGPFPVSLQLVCIAVVGRANATNHELYVLNGPRLVSLHASQEIMDIAPQSETHKKKSTPVPLVRVCNNNAGAVKRWMAHGKPWETVHLFFFARTSS